jgi:hypothetical protein
MCDRESLVQLCSQHLLASRECYEKAAGIRPNVAAGLLQAPPVSA